MCLNCINLLIIKCWNGIWRFQVIRNMIWVFITLLDNLHIVQGMPWWKNVFQTWGNLKNVATLKQHLIFRCNLEYIGHICIILVYETNPIFGSVSVRQVIYYLELPHRLLKQCHNLQTSTWIFVESKAFEMICLVSKYLYCTFLLNVLSISIFLVLLSLVIRLTSFALL